MPRGVLFGVGRVARDAIHRDHDVEPTEGCPSSCARHGGPAIAMAVMDHVCEIDEKRFGACCAENGIDSFGRDMSPPSETAPLEHRSTRPKEAYCCPMMLGYSWGANGE